VKVGSQGSWLTPLVDVARDVAEAAETALSAAKLPVDPGLPPRPADVANKARVDLSPAVALDPKDVGRWIKANALVRTVVALGALDTPANRQVVREQLAAKGMTLGDALMQCPPGDYLARRSFALAFAETASEQDLLHMMDALSRSKGGPEVIEADRTTMLRLVFFPRPDAALTERLIAALLTRGFSAPDIHEHQAEVA
jgi:hypothetical protein